MTRKTYYTKATITNKELIERIKKSFFHYKGPYSYETFDDDGERTYVATDQIDANFLDLAHFFGFRDTFYRQDGDHPLTNKEWQWLNDIAHKQIPVYPKMVTYDPTESDYCTNEFRERLVRCEISYDIEDDFELVLDGMFFTGLFRAMTIMYPGVEIRLQEYESHANGDSCDSYYIVKYGALVESWHNDSEKDKVPSNPHRLAIYYGEKGEYRKSLKMLKTLKKDGDVLNDIGVNYERLGNYKKAYKFYKKANSEWSLINVLRLYDNDKIVFNLNEYHNICAKLTDMGCCSGVTRESNLYHFGNKIVKPDRELSLKIAKDGYEKFPSNPETIVQYAWCQAFNIKSEKDKLRIYRLYQKVLYSSERPKDDELYRTAMNNYAWLCLTAHGCKQNIPEAIYWFTRSYENGYRDCAEQLAIIYSTCEGYLNKEIAHFWLEQLTKNNEKGEH